MEYVLVTNNDRCRDAFQENFRVEFSPDWTYHDVLIHTRDLLHQGYRLTTHPMAGSLKPNQTPYKSILLTPHTLKSDSLMDDVMLLEKCIENHDKFMKNHELFHWSDKIKEDFKTVDLSLIQGAANNAIIARM